MSGDGDLFFLISQARSSGSSLDASLLLPLWTQSSPLYLWHTPKALGTLHPSTAVLGLRPFIMPGLQW